MNRLKLWLFALVVIALALASLYPLSVELRGPALAALDKRLDSATAAARRGERVLAARLGGAAVAAARDPRVAAALAPAPEAEPAGKRRAPPPPPPDPAAQDAALAQAATVAVADADRALAPLADPARAAPTANGAGAAPAPGELLVFAGTRDSLQRRAAAEGAAGEAPAVALVVAALDGHPQQGWRVVQGQLVYGVAVPAGPGVALGVFQPIDERWLLSALAETGATGVLTAPGAKLVTTDPPHADMLLRGTQRGVKDVGTLEPPRLAFAGLRLPALPSVLGKLPALRAGRLPLGGIDEGAMVLAVPAAPLLDPVARAQALVIWGAVLIVVLALLFSILVKPTEIAAPVPPALVEAASKIERGDFSARAPIMAGMVGTVASALNRAAEAAQGAGRPADVAAVAGAPPSVTQEFFAKHEPAPDVTDPFALPTRGPRSAPVPLVGEPPPPPPPPPPASAPEALSGTAFEAAPVATPAATAAAVAAPPEAAATDPDQEHWREVFREFVRVRAECGEPSEGLTFERFRHKLEANKAALVAKYACKTVRFSVYVKEGKAALKATPVR